MIKIKKLDFELFKQEALKDPEVKRAHEALAPEYELMRERIKARKRARVSRIE